MKKQTKQPTKYLTPHPQKKDRKKEKKKEHFLCLPGFSFFFVSRNLSSLSISDTSLPQAIGGVMSLASVVPTGIMSQVSQHFGYSKIQATFDVSFVPARSFFQHAGSSGLAFETFPMMFVRLSHNCPN